MALVNLPVMRVEWREGDVIRRLRLYADWRLEDLAAASGVSFQAINKIELGKTKDPRGRTLQKIASAFGLTERQLRNAVPVPMDLPIQLTSIGRASENVEPVIRREGERGLAPSGRRKRKAG